MAELVPDNVSVSSSHDALGFLSLELNLAARARDPFLNFLSTTLNINLHGDFAQSESGRSLQSTIKWTAPYIEGQKTSLTDLPPSLLHQIFTHLDPCTSTCLGLTAWPLYSIFRSHHPGKISLWEACHEPLYHHTVSLGDLLESWIGPLYRRRIWTLYTIISDIPLREHAYPIPQYLLKSSYGSQPSSPSFVNAKENNLALRWLDHGQSQKTCPKTGDISYILPSPYEMEENAWCYQSFEAMKMDAYPASSWGEWMGFWGEFGVFGRMAYMEKLKMLEWWEDCGRRGGLRESWWDMLWFVVGLGVGAGWWRRWVRFVVMRTVGREDGRPWPSPRRGQGVVAGGKTESEDGIV